MQKYKKRLMDSNLKFYYCTVHDFKTLRHTQDALKYAMQEANTVVKHVCLVHVYKSDQNNEKTAQWNVTNVFCVSSPYVGSSSSLSIGTELTAHLPSAVTHS